jgi:hypothetical protein
LTLLLCAALTGCGSGLGEVSGTVRYNGQPLPGGTIQFLGPDGVPCAGTIQPDGTYAVRVPPGEAKVIVSRAGEGQPTRFAARAAGGPARLALRSKARGQGPRLPARYADWDASGLTVLVEGSITVQDFDLVSR